MLLVVALAGCEPLGYESAATVAARREAEGKAIGGACRHAGRAIEDCYALNRKAEKAAIFAGWREMNDYMRENNLQAVAPQLTAGPNSVMVPPASAPASEASEAPQASGKGRRRES
nr:hypothetical protein [Azohydromonas caseinilytica]